jgi:hypothetical protein
VVHEGHSVWSWSEEPNKNVFKRDWGWYCIPYHERSNVLQSLAPSPELVQLPERFDALVVLFSGYYEVADSHDTLYPPVGANPVRLDAPRSRPPNLSKTDSLQAQLSLPVVGVYNGIEPVSRGALQQGWSARVPHIEFPQDHANVPARRAR